MTTEVNCPKCDGKGFIDGVSHIANGVCFCCKGAKVVKVNLSKKRAKLSADTIKKAEWVMNSTSASYGKFSWAQHQSVRNFCYSGFGLNEAYPELLQHYRSVGESFFFAEQNRQLEAYNAA